MGFMFILQVKFYYHYFVISQLAVCLFRKAEREEVAAFPPEADKVKMTAFVGNRELCSQEQSEHKTMAFWHGL